MTWPKLRWQLYHYALVWPLLKILLFVKWLYDKLDTRANHYWYLARRNNNKQKALRWLTGLEGADHVEKETPPESLDHEDFKRGQG